ncbi:MAG: NmrA family NAD(P)-binding protein [Minicystis sp.]
MFTVFGATGNTGSIVAERLLAAGKRVRAVTRNPDKAAHLREKGAEIVAGDVTDAALVARALEGAEGAYLLAPPDLQSNDLLAKNRGIVDSYVAGLAGAKVPHAVFLSSVGTQLAEGTGPSVFSHYGETTLPKASATRFTFVRAPFFMENLLGNAQPMKSAGVLPVFGGGEAYPFPMIATRDIGETAAAALLDPPAATQWIELRGPRDYSYVEAAAIASEILGRKVTATVLPLDAIVPTLTKAGFSENVAGLFRELNEALGRGIIQYEGKGRLVRGSVELAEVLRAGLA